MMLKLKQKVSVKSLYKGKTFFWQPAGLDKSFFVFQSCPSDF